MVLEVGKGLSRPARYKLEGILGSKKGKREERGGGEGLNWLDRWKVGRGSKKGERKGEEGGRKGGKDRNLNLTARQ